MSGYYVRKIRRIFVSERVRALKLFSARNEHEGEFHGAGQEHECAERETLRQDRANVEELPPARGEAQLHSVVFGWPGRGDRDGLADIRMRAHTNGRYSAEIATGEFLSLNV